MTRRIAIAEVRDAGITLHADEAVAVTQRLIDVCSKSDRDLRRPYGPPTPSNVFLGAEGSVDCPSCDATLGVSEAAIFLQALLPDGTPRVPGGLRYTVARALLEVDAPPFDSLEDFSRALARHERRDRGDVISHLLERACAARADGPPSLDAFERRRSAASTADLRRDLREADARLYDQQLALQALGAMTSPMPPRPRRKATIASAVALGLMVIGAAEVVPRMTVQRAAADPAPAAAVAPPPAAPAGRVASPVRPVVAEIRNVEAAPTPRKSTPRAADPSVRRVNAVQRSSRAQPRRSGGLLRRLHMEWLKSKVVIRSDAL